MTKEEWNLKVDEYIRNRNELVGKPVVTSSKIASSFPLAHSLVTDEVIHDYACNIGDNNPLFNSTEYAKKTQWGGAIAPAGGFVRYLAETGSFSREGALEGFSFLYGGTTYEYNDVIRAGESYHIHDDFLGVTEKKLPPEKAAKYRLLSISDRRSYINQNGKTIVTATGTVLVTCVYPGNIKKEDSVVYGKVEKPSYTYEELESIYRYYEDYCDGKYTRGAKPRYWEDVAEGEDMPVMIKGPLDVTDMASYACAVGLQMGGAATKWESIRYLHDVRDPETNNYLNRDAFHYSDLFGRANGFPMALVYGALQECYLCEYVTDWIGDDGFVKQIKLQQRRPCFHGDIIYVKGHVARKFIEDGEYLVELQYCAKNQNGVKLIPASAIVRLPTKNMRK